MSRARRLPRLLRSKLPIRFTSYRRHPAAGDGFAIPPSKPAARAKTALFSLRTRRPRPTGTSLPRPAWLVERDRLSLTLPVPPSINHQYATVNGRRLLSAAGRHYKAEVGQQVLLAMARSSERQALLDNLQHGPLALSIAFYFTSPLRRDVDGGLKITQDALCEALGLNDNRITETHLYKRQDIARPRVEITLSLSAPDGGGAT